MEKSMTFDEAYSNLQSIMKIPTFEASQEDYDKRSKTYDEQHSVLGLTHSMEAASLCLKYVSKSETTTLLDIGAGTGSVAEFLRKDGFVGVIDLLEANMEMLYLASKKGVRPRNMIRHVVTGPLPLKSESYDAVTCIGCLLNNGIQPVCIKDILEVLKPGGHLIFNARESGTAYANELEGILAKLTEDKMMELIESKDFFILKRLSKLPSKLYIYRKL